MTKSIPEVVVSLKDIYKTYSDHLIFSDKVSGLLINHSDIPASGNELEIAFRKVLQDLLPSRVVVGHGHFVDKNLNMSYQQDVLVSENQFSKSLVKTLDGTEIFPYESIFAIGEIKRRWSQKRLKEHVKSIKRSKIELIRNKIASNVFDTGVNFVKTSTNLTVNPFRNPLFCFSFSIDFDAKYSKKMVSKILKSESQDILPNLIVVLKAGIFVKVNKKKLDENHLEVILYPEFKGEDSNLEWVFLRLDPEETLVYLVFLLSQHLNESVLEKASYLEYIDKMVGVSLTNIEFL